MRIDGLYSRQIVSGDRGEALTKAASQMRSNNVSALPVLVDGKLVGILTERDLARAAADGVDPNQTTLDRYMTLDPAVAHPEEDSADVASRMLENGVRHLLVVDRGALLGIISARDLMLLEAWPPRTPTAT